MASFENRVTAPLDRINAELVGSGLLEKFKEAMIGQLVFRAMFGEKGERIFIEEIPNYNDTIFPLLELWWDTETYNNWDTEQTGQILGRIILPVRLRGAKAVNLNFQRQVAMAITRFLGSKRCNLFGDVPGLTMFGAGTSFQYSQMFQLSGLVAPAITMRIPFTFDLKLYTQIRPDADVHGDLDEDLLAAVESYKIQPFDEETGVIHGGGVEVKPQE